MSTRRVPHAAHWGAFDAIVADGRFVRAEPLPEEGPQQVGSSYASSYPQAVHAPVRVARPAVRAGWLAGGDRARSSRGQDRFVEVDWDTALDLVAGELSRVRRDHGMQAVFGGSYGWSSAGRFHHAKTQLSRFLAGLGGYVGQRGTYSYAAGAEILPHVLGENAIAGPMTSWSVIADNTDLLVAFGGISWGNMQIEAGGLGRHSGQAGLQQLLDAGVDVVSVGPVRPEGPRADQIRWLPIRPGTDVALMLAMLYVLFTERSADEAFLSEHTTGAEQVRDYVLGHGDGQAKTPAWAARRCGIEAGEIVALARRCTTRRSLLTAAWSLQRAEHGEQPFWALITLAAAIGQIGLPGGGFGFGYGSTSGVGNPRQKVAVPTMPVLTNPLRDEYIPVARITEMLESPGSAYEFNGMHRRYPHVRLIYWVGGNPFHHHQDLFRLRRAWQRPETIVVHEPWWTATARHADIVLPATTTLERNDIAAASRDRLVRAMHQAVAPVGQARSDFAIFQGLAERLGTAASFDEGRDETAWLELLWNSFRERCVAADVPCPGFRQFWSEGQFWLPEAEPVVAGADLRAGAPLHTPSGRIELYSATIAGFEYDDCPGQASWLEPREWLGSPLAGTYPLHLVSTQPRHRLHSQLDMGPDSRSAKVHGREPVRLHPDDAAARGLGDGDLVEILNDRGSCLAGLLVTDAVMPGVAELSTGAWFEPDPTGEPRCLHGNPNVLTRDVGTSRLAQGPSAHSALVQIRRADPTQAPAVTVLDEPPPLTSAEGEGEGEGD